MLHAFLDTFTDKTRFTPIGISIQCMLRRGLHQLASVYKWLLFRFGLRHLKYIAEGGKFNHVSYAPLAVAISTKKI